MSKMVQTLTVGFVTDENKNSLKQSDVIFILTNSDDIYYNNLPMGVRYVIGRLVNEENVKLPFGAKFIELEVILKNKSNKTLSFTLPEKVKLELGNKSYLSKSVSFRAYEVNGKYEYKLSHDFIVRTCIYYNTVNKLYLT